jgi:hypothetical protein
MEITKVESKDRIPDDNKPIPPYGAQAKLAEEEITSKNERHRNAAERMVKMAEIIGPWDVAAEALILVECIASYSKHFASGSLANSSAVDRLSTG